MVEVRKLRLIQRKHNADGVVAHGFYPTDGKLHFDASERWTLNMRYGVNLYQVTGKRRSAQCR